MARPRKKGLDYYTHDTAASHDLKIMAMELEHGLAGYAFYFKMLELIYSEGSSDGLNLGDKGVYGACVKALGIGKEGFDALLETAVEVGLFDAECYRDTAHVTSESIQKRMGFISSRRVSAAETQQKPYNNDAECLVSAEFPSRERKEKESKEKKSTGKEKNTRAPAKDKPSPSRESDQITTLFADHAGGDTELIDAFTGFAEMRKKIKKPIGLRAAQLLISELNKLGDKSIHAALLNQSTMNGWASVYPLKDNQYRAGAPPRESMSNNIFADMARERGAV